MTLEEAREKLPPMWVIYDHPLDHPEVFVARLWFGESPTNQTIMAADLDAVREAIISRGCSIPLPPDPSDDPKIVETWV